MVAVRTILFLLQLFLVVLVAANLNNIVCDTVWDYLFKPISKNCRFNPDVNSNTADMIKRNGYPFESYQITTNDGFVLSLYRIPHNNKDTKSKRRPVFVLHGIQTSSESWTNMRDRSLAFNLVENGYDVWLGNFRGTLHSRIHSKYTTKDYEFWNYSFHEIGLYDVSSFLNFIKNATEGNGRIIYVGHSLATSASYVYASLKKEEAQENLAGLISLSPTAFGIDIKGAVSYFIPLRKLIDIWSKLFHQNSLFADYKTMRLLYDVTCDQFLFFPLCRIIFYEFGGYDYKRIRPEQMPVIYSHFAIGGSLKTFQHYWQFFSKKDKFLMYDYEKDNLKWYNQEEPPEYPLEKISLPVHLIFGTHDYVATPKAVKMIFERLNTTKSITEIDYTHTDFIIAIDVKQNLYPIMMEKMKEIEDYDERKRQ